MEKKFNLALVTGATGGIGSALCRLLAKKKIPLLITGRNGSQLQLLANELSPLVSIIVVIADLETTHGQTILLEQINLYVPDLIINNAGFGLYGDAASLEIAEQVGMINVNITAPLKIALAAAKALIAANRPGVIINISSAASYFVFPSFAVYAASKAFITNFSQSIDDELSPKNIRVLTSCPGVVATGFKQRASKGKVLTSGSLSMTQEFAANEIWNQITTDKSVHIFNWKTRLGILISYLLPRKFVSSFLRSYITQ